MKQQYLFYDLETSGLNKSFDQILQFAAIKTDDQLNPIDEIEFFIQLKPDVIPAPYASITHRISIDKTNHGLREYDAIKKIHQLVNTPNTISIGYNSLKFDDEFLRFCFYRNLLPAYTHQYANNCQRMDIYPMLILYYLFKPNLLKWPELDGNISLKLENIAAENEFNVGNAHDALVDVKATLKLAEILRSDKKMWQYVSGYFNKQTDTQRILALKKSINNLPLAIYVAGQVGKDNLFHCPVLGIGQHQQYKNQTLWLRLDHPALASTQIDYVEETTICYKKKYGEPGFILPHDDKHTSRLTDERIKTAQQNLAWLKNNPDKLKAIQTYYQQYTYPIVPDIDANAALYDNGFLSRAEEEQCRAFHQAMLTKKIDIANDFSNPVLHELALRLICNNFPDQSPDDFKHDFQQYVESIYQNKFTAMDYRGQKRLSPKQALTDIETIMQEKSPDQAQQTLLNELKNHILKKP